MILPMILSMLLGASLALARPDDGGDMFSFDASDEVVSLDSPLGTVRVWYSVSGPNLTRLDDDDGDGVPDFPAEVAATAEAVLAFYEELGLRPPLTDGGRGGNDAMDAYLVDFGGLGDGQFSSERCNTVGTASQCYGYFVMENDFSGYGYSDLSSAIRTLTSHELFHAVQAAYDAGEEVWWSEGTATWGEWAFDPGSTDFLALCNTYLDDPSRSLDQPPAGATSFFAYGTALWWYFLTNRHGDALMAELLLATEAGDALLEEMSAAEEAHGSSLAVDWADFSLYNLATGNQSGAVESYSFAADLNPPAVEERDDSWSDDYRFYPLATTYVLVRHKGGPLYFALAEDTPSLVFSLHPEDDEGRVLPAVDRWTGEAGTRELGELPDEDYWLIATNPTLDEDSTKVLVCVGDEDAIAPCLAELEDSGVAVDTGTEKPPAEGCGCDAGARSGGVVSWLGGGWLGLLAAWGARRRQEGARRPITDPAVRLHIHRLASCPLPLPPVLRPRSGPLSVR